MKNKEDIINKIIKDNDYTAYLELGFGDGYNFNKIECEIKNACDTKPNPYFVGDSDAFFDTHKDNAYDVVFIDADHEASQVRQDIINSLRALSKNGCIILHDSLPIEKNQQIEPRMQKVYCGTVWRAVVGFIESYPDIKVETYRSDFGLTVVYPEGKKTRKHFENKEMTYEDFKANEVELLKIVD